ncbi:MAG: hypothetical protein WC010_02345 [Candidatus Absconditabacterales bacterium]
MLKSYAFDVDYNLIFTNDTIILDKKGSDNNRSPVEVSQKDYEEFIKDKINYRHFNDSIEQSMVNFRGADRYEKTIFDAINQGKFGPSWEKFVEANRYASPMAFITARGHHAEDLKETHRKIIYDVLTSGHREDLIYSMKERLGNYKLSDDVVIDTYLNDNYYAPCSNETFLETINKNVSDSMPARKNAAFEQFVIHTKQVFEKYYGTNFMSTRKIRVGFSDDTYKNIEGLHNFIYTKNTGMMRRYPEILFRLYNTFEIRTAPTKFSYKNPEEEKID